MFCFLVLDVDEFVYNFDVMLVDYFAECTKGSI